MRRGTIKRGIKKYTAIIPKTVNATKRLTTLGKNRVKYFLKGTKSRARKIPRRIDSSISKFLRTFTKKHGRK